MREGDVTRVPLRQEDGDPGLSALFARAETEMGRVPNLYRALANAPILLASWIDYAWSLRSDPELDRGLRELAILRVAQLAGCDYVWRSHWRLARHFGHPADKLLDLSNWPNSLAFSPAERTMLTVTDQLSVMARVDDSRWWELAAVVGAAQAVELVMTLAWYAGVVRVVSALEIPLDDDHMRTPGVPNPIDRPPPE